MNLVKIQYLPKSKEENQKIDEAFEEFKSALDAYQKENPPVFRFTYKALPFKTYEEAIAYATTGKFLDQN